MVLHTSLHAFYFNDLAYLFIDDGIDDPSVIHKPMMSLCWKQISKQIIICFYKVDFQYSILDIFVCEQQLEVRDLLLQ